MERGDIETGRIATCSILKSMKLYPTQLMTVITLSSNIPAALSYLYVFKNRVENSSTNIKVVNQQHKATTPFSHLKKSECSRLAYSLEII